MLGVVWLAEDNFLLVGLFYPTEAHFMPLSFRETAYYRLAYRCDHFRNKRLTVCFTRKGQSQIHFSRPLPAPCRVQALLGRYTRLSNLNTTNDHQAEPLNNHYMYKAQPLFLHHKANKYQSRFSYLPNYVLTRRIRYNTLYGIKSRRAAG